MASMVFSCTNCQTKFRLKLTEKMSKTNRFTCRKCGQKLYLVMPNENDPNGAAYAIEDIPNSTYAPPENSENRTSRLQIIAGSGQYPQTEQSQTTAEFPAPPQQDYPAPGHDNLNIVRKPWHATSPNVGSLWATETLDQENQAFHNPFIPGHHLGDPQNPFAAHGVADSAPLTGRHPSGQYQAVQEPNQQPGQFSQKILEQKRKRKIFIIAIVVVILLAAAGAAAFFLWDTGEPASIPEVATTQAPAAVHPGTSRQNQMIMYSKQDHQRFLACKASMDPPPQATIDVKLELTVGPSGSIESPLVEPQRGIASRPLVECIKEIVAKWQFSAESDQSRHSLNLSL